MRDDTLSIYRYTNFLRLIPLIFPPAAIHSDKCIKPIQIPFSYLTPIPAGLSIKTDVPGKIEFLFPSCLRRYFHERVGWNTRFGSICTRVDNGKRIFVLYCRRSFLLLLLLFFSLSLSPFSSMFHIIDSCSLLGHAQECPQWFTFVPPGLNALTRLFLTVCACERDQSNGVNSFELILIAKQLWLLKFLFVISLISRKYRTTLINNDLNTRCWE